VSEPHPPVSEAPPVSEPHPPVSEAPPVSEPHPPVSEPHPVAEPTPTTSVPEAPVPARARRAANFSDVDPLIGHPPPEPLPPALAGNYRYVTNPRPPPPRSLRRVVADDERFAQLAIDRDGNLAYGRRGRPTPDVPFDAELATPLDVPDSARLVDTDSVGGGRSVRDSLDARRQAVADRTAARASGDRAAYDAAGARMARESELVGDAAGRSYMRGRGTVRYEGHGPNTFDQVWRNTTPPPEFTVIEAKGGSATNAGSRVGADGRRYQQGTEPYLRSIIEESIAGNPRSQLPRDVALELERALDRGMLDYIEVAQPIAEDGSLLAPFVRRYF
jgi:hypothetical protein